MPGPVRDGMTQATVGAVQQFNAAFNRHDVDGVMALMTSDCLFDSTRPAPDGERIEGEGPPGHVRGVDLFRG